jgi:hypothetical protein
MGPDTRPAGGNEGGWQHELQTGIAWEVPHHYYDPQYRNSNPQFSDGQYNNAQLHSMQEGSPQDSVPSYIKPPKPGSHDEEVARQPYQTSDATVTDANFSRAQTIAIHAVMLIGPFFGGGFSSLTNLYRWLAQTFC